MSDSSASTESLLAGYRLMISHALLPRRAAEPDVRVAAPGWRELPRARRELVAGGGAGRAAAHHRGAVGERRRRPLGGVADHVEQPAVGRARRQAVHGHERALGARGVGLGAVEAIAGPREAPIGAAVARRVLPLLLGGQAAAARVAPPAVARGLV